MRILFIVILQMIFLSIVEKTQVVFADEPINESTILIVYERDDLSNGFEAEPSEKDVLVESESNPRTSTQIQVSLQKCGKLLTELPPEATATLKYDKINEDKFYCTVEVKNFWNEDEYMLCLHRVLWDPSDKAFQDQCKTYENSSTKLKEGYCDFGNFTVDEKGNAIITANQPLPPGTYKAKFFIKDVTKDWKIIFCGTVEFEIKK